MQVDLEHQELPREFKSQFCIVGGGIAGLLLASRIARGGGEVHLLEAGGMELEERSQELYGAISTGKSHAGIREGRFRTFGGSSTRWGGQLLPYTEDVLQPPSVLGMPEWPLGSEELTPYYGEILDVLGASSAPFTSDLLKEFGAPKPFDSDDVQLRFSKWAPFSRRNLAKTLGAECLGDSRITIYFHANATKIRLSPDGKAVAAVEAKNYNGEKFVFRAAVYLLCIGTIETSRLLLASVSECARGVGNDYDQVGRYFHDHVGVRVAEFTPEDRQRVLRWFAPWMKRGTLHTAKLEATRKLREERGLLSVMAHFPIEEPEDSGAARLRRLLQGVQRGKLDGGIWADVAGLPSASMDVARIVYGVKVLHRCWVSPRARVALHLDVEQKPDMESRIMVTDERDALGMRKAAVQWKISGDEHRTVQDYARVVDRLLRETGVATPCWNRDVLDSYAGFVAGGKDTYHMMGGTRMGTDPKRSVVGPNLRVHGIDNLHVVSCSVFPTGGSSNPTFTMMALALRKAEELAQSSQKKADGMKHEAWR